MSVCNISIYDISYLNRPLSFEEEKWNVLEFIDLKYFSTQNWSNCQIQWNKIWNTPLK